MRNSYPGACYRCGERVEVGEGHFERFRGGWRTQHAACAIEYRGTPDPEREADRLKWLAVRAMEPGKRGNRARRQLREIADQAGGR